MSWDGTDGQPNSSMDPKGYDSDDEYYDLMNSKDCDGQTKEQIQTPASDPSLDRRFTLPLFTPPRVRALCRRGFAVRGADTAISLSPDLEDTILVQSEVLKESHEVFRIGLQPRWAHNKVGSAVQEMYGPRIEYLYELELDTDGDAVLIGKTTPTPAEERQTSWTSRYKKTHKFHVAVDEVDAYAAYTSSEQYSHFLSSVAHKIGFAMLCGFPMKMFRTRSHQFLKHPELLLKVLEWIHEYGNFNSMRSQFEHLILARYRSQHASEMQQVPDTYLRFAVLLRSKELFRRCLTLAVAKFEWRVEVSGYQMAYDELLENLAHDCRLASHVTTLYSRVHGKINSVHQSLLAIHHVFHPKATWYLANEIFRDWYLRASSTAKHANVFDAIREVGGGKLEPHQLIEEYRTSRFVDRKTGVARAFPPPYIKLKVLGRAVQGVTDEAFDLARDCFDDEGRLFSERGDSWDGPPRHDFTGYRYPWQERDVTRVSKLTDLMEVMATQDIGEDEADTEDD